MPASYVRTCACQKRQSCYRGNTHHLIGPRHPDHAKERERDRFTLWLVCRSGSPPNRHMYLSEPVHTATAMQGNSKIIPNFLQVSVLPAALQYTPLVSTLFGRVGSTATSRQARWPSVTHGSEFLEPSCDDLVFPALGGSKQASIDQHRGTSERNQRMNHSVQIHTLDLSHPDGADTSLARLESCRTTANIRGTAVPVDTYEAPALTSGM